MKNKLFATLSSLTLFTAAAAFAQGNRGMHADIPFAFRIGTTVLPAGQYEVRPQESGVLLIRCIPCKAAALIVMNRISPGKTQASELVFNRYGETRFLSRISLPQYSLGKELSKSKAEREFARNSSPVEPSAVALARR